MNRPPVRTMVLGHTATVFTAAALLALSGFVFVHNPESWPFGLFCVFIMHKVMQAHEAVIAYRQWHAEWQMLSGGDPPRKAKPGRALAVTAGLALVWLAYDQPLLVASGAGYAAGWASQQPLLLAFLALLGLSLVSKAVLRLRRRPRGSKPSKPVTVIAKRIFPVPTLAEAYCDLPPYCHALLRGQQ